MNPLDQLVSLNPMEPLELTDAVLIVSHGQIVYQAPLPSDPNAFPEWQLLSDGMRRAAYAHRYETATAIAHADPDRLAEGGEEKPGA